MATWHERGLAGCSRKVWAAAGATLPLLLRKRRTAGSVAAYFDLITDEARRFYGDSFHLGYFRTGDEGLQQALVAHTQLIARFARIERAHRVLDVGCGIGEPAVWIANRYGCRVVGVNLSREQIRQGRELVAARGLAERVELERGDARSLAFPDGSFDAILCLEAAGDICVTPADKERLVGELFRLLRSGGRVGFSDLALLREPSTEDDEVLRAVLHHTGSELVTDWPAMFERGGFEILERRDILAQTLPTWARARSVYEQHRPDVLRRYGRRLTDRILGQLQAIANILAAHGTFPALSARKP